MTISEPSTISTSSSTYSNHSDSSISSLNGTSHDDDPFCPTWLKPVTNLLQPIVIQGEFQDFDYDIGNPYLRKNHLGGDGDGGGYIGGGYEISEDFLKIHNYEMYFNKKLNRLIELKGDIERNGKHGSIAELDQFIFNHLKDFKILSDYYLKQLGIVKNGGNHEREIEKEDLVYHHLKMFHKILIKFHDNYASLLVSFKTLKEVFNRQLKNIELEDELFQYPFQYWGYYEKLGWIGKFDFGIAEDDTINKITAESNNLEQTLTTFHTTYHTLQTLEHDFLCNGSPFSVYLTKILEMTQICESVNNCIIDPEIEDNITPLTEKFRQNSMKSIYDFLKIKLSQEIQLADEMWDSMCDYISQLRYELERIVELVREYEQTHTHIRKKMKYITKVVELENVLVVMLPKVNQIMLKFSQLFGMIFLHNMIKMLTQIRGSNTITRESINDDGYKAIIESFQDQIQFKKGVLLQAHYNQEAILKYYDDPRQVFFDIVPMNSQQSFVIAKLFD